MACYGHEAKDLWEETALYQAAGYRVQIGGVATKFEPSEGSTSCMICLHSIDDGVSIGKSQLGGFSNCVLSRN